MSANTVPLRHGLVACYVHNAELAAQDREDQRDDKFDAEPAPASPAKRRKQAAARSRARGDQLELGEAQRD